MTAATTTTERTGWSVSRLAAEGLGDRRALAKLLRDVEPVAQGPSGEALYRLRDVVKALAQRQVEGETARLRVSVQALEAQLAGADACASESESRRRKRAAEAQLLELQLKQERGEWAPIFECEHAGIALFGGIVQRLDAIPSKIAVDLAAESSPPVCQEIVAKALHEARGAIADVRIVKAKGRYAVKLEALLSEFRTRLYALVTEDEEPKPAGTPPL